MNIRKERKASYGKWFLADVMRAVNNYALIDPGEEVCVALSGGRDSTTLLYILWYLKTYEQLDVNLCGLHVQTDDYSTDALAELCAALDVKYMEARVRVARRISARNICPVCTKLKTGAMAQALQGAGIRKVAFGHHADDVAENLLMNIVYNKKLGSFGPREDASEEGIVFIRPFIYLDGPLIKRLHTHFRLPSIFYECPYADRDIRASMRKAIVRIEEQIETKDFSRMVVSALENTDTFSFWPDASRK
jgi:tRNA 2-thiocytidine biosynthesis protein TtcA